MSTEPLQDIEAGGAVAGDVGASPGGGVEDPESKGMLKPIAETTPMERFAGIMAGGAVATSLAAIIIEQSAIVIVAGVFSIVMGPYAYWQQTRLTDIAALKETHEAIRAEVDRLHAENERLCSSINDLSETVQRLEEVEMALDVITKTQGQSVNAFEEQVNQNKEILVQMQKNHKANVLQNLLSVILRSDKDGDLNIDENEIDDLVYRLQRISGVELHEDRFREAIKGKSIDSVMEIVKNLLKDDLPEEEKIFEIKEEDE